MLGEEASQVGGREDKKIDKLSAFTETTKCGLRKTAEDAEI